MKNAMCFLIVLMVSILTLNFIIQDKVITGVVIDELSYQPLVGANVLQKGTSNATLTDLDGKYSLRIAEENAILVISYPGFVTREVNIAKKEHQIIEMSVGQFEEEVIEMERPELSGNRSLDGVVGILNGKTYNQGKVRIRGYGSHNQSYMPPHDGGQNWNTEDYDLITENKFHSPLNEPLSTFSIDVDGASYSNMRRFLKNGQNPPIDAVRIEEMVNYFNYNYPEPEGPHPFSITTEVGNCPWNNQHKLVHVGLQGKNIETENLPSSNLVFLIDVSGSMNQPNKLPLLKSSFRLLVDQLRPQDRVAIAVYAGSSGLVLPSTPGSQKDKILAALEQLQAGGSTAGAAGIKLAYKTAKENFAKEGNNRVILATDGDFNVGVSSDAELVRIIEKERESGVFLTVLGFGEGNLKDNKMQKLANKGNGNHGYIDNILEAKKVFINEFGGTLFTIAKDVKIQVEFNPENVQAYRLIGYENRLLNKEDFNDDTKDAGEIGSGHTVTALYEIIPTGVKSSFVKSVDDLKYQKSKQSGKWVAADEWMHVKFRYKDPNGSESKLIEEVITSKDLNKKVSDNFNWSAAVAGFGMILRDSEFKSNVSLEMVESLAMEAKGEDPFGYRHEFVGLVQSMKLLASK